MYAHIVESSEAFVDLTPEGVILLTLLQQLTHYRCPFINMFIPSSEKS